VKITELRVSNYKSCREVLVRPQSLTVIIGRNAAGKSNFVDAIDFLSHVYRGGLENAVALKGGYENIAFRRARRARSEIGFQVKAKFFAANLRVASQVGQRPSSVPKKDGISVEYCHDFAFRAQGRDIASDFSVTRETLSVQLKDSSGSLIDTVSIRRTSDNKVALDGDAGTELARNFVYFFEYSNSDLRNERGVAPTELMLSLPFMSGRILSKFLRFIRNMAIFQVSPELARESGVPSPNPVLSRSGQNLPAVINWLKKKAPAEWLRVQEAMQEIAPEIERIEVGYLHTKTLGLYFYEGGVSRPWTVEDMSDGTVRALAMLVSCFDPRNSVLIIEEPENSVHPWVIQNLVKSLRDISVSRNVIMTSHSPSVINSISPEDVWVAYKRAGSTSVAHLVELDPQVLTDWKEGAYRLFDYIESGFVPEALPGGVA